MRSHLVVLVLSAGAVSAQSPSSQELPAQTGTLTDPRDGEVYETVVIGSQRWLKENLRYDHGSGSRCFDDRPDYCERYGRLYTWSAAVRSCPPGWHLPTEQDWRQLESALGMQTSELDRREYRGEREGANLRVGGGSGFDARLTGYMRPDGTPRRLNERAAFWTATEHRPGESSWHRDISADPRVYRSPVDHEYYLSVRCVADSPA